MTIQSMLSELIKTPSGSAQERLALEIGYAARVCGEESRPMLACALEKALGWARQNGAVTKAQVEQIERELSALSPQCKRYEWLLAGHAHIDMNWLWGYDETASIVLDTFRTVLRLMEKHPGFIFSQSQASTYAIVAAYAPEMLEEIKRRIREGRWEVTASTWVEADHNLPSLESELRHLLYTKRYLSGLLDISPETLDIDFEPDTFGHNAFLPDVYRQGGIRYFYHCRGEGRHSLYRWRGESGHEVIALCESDWYNNTVDGRLAWRVPEFCRENHTRGMMTVYGVGDHGGGPTNRDLNRIEDMATWPLFPAVRFAAFHDFFALAEEARGTLPVLEGERNIMFSGCYTSQSRIKRGNMRAERMLYESELFGALAHTRADGAYRREQMERAWRRTLFNQFHDIVTGSCKAESREYAMGEYQKVYADAGAMKKNAYAALAARADSSVFASPEDADSTAEGAGVGYGVSEGAVSGVARGGAETRVFHLFNSLPFDRERTAEIAVWDCAEDPAALEFIDAQGNALPFQTLEQKYEEYWGHHVTRCLVRARVPACGYATIGLRKRENDDFSPMGRAFGFWRVEECADFVLENELIRAELDPVTLRLRTLLDKRTGRERRVDGGFDLICEDPSDGMTAWNVGRFAAVMPVAAYSTARRGAFGALRQSYTLSARFGEGSTLRCSVSLDAGSSRIEYDVTCDWREVGSAERGVPQLCYRLQADEAPAAFSYRAPGGMITRPGARQNKPSLGAIGGGGLCLLCDGTYGYRGEGAAMSVSLVRGSFDPDPLPEKGEIRSRVAVCVTEEANMSREYADFAHPIDAAAGEAHTGTLPPAHSLLRLESAHTLLTAVKLAQDEEVLIVHLNNEGAAERVSLTMDAPIRAAWLVDALERPLGECACEGGRLTLPMAAYEIALLKLDLA